MRSLFFAARQQKWKANSDGSVYIWIHIHTHSHTVEFFSEFNARIGMSMFTFQNKMFALDLVCIFYGVHSLNQLKHKLQISTFS